MTTIPQFKHECSSCIFLGVDTLAGHDNIEYPVDIYVCKQIGSPTVLIRFGNKPSDYTSWNFIILESPLDDSEDLPFTPNSEILARKYYEQAKEAINKEMSP